MTSRAPKRKPHSKSRRGCLQCKKRHIKCNEVHPRCSNCARLDIACDWQPRQDDPPYNSPSPLPYPFFNKGEKQQLPPETGMPLRDLALLHHWSTQTYSTILPDMPSQHMLWRDTIVEIGFAHPFLLHGILALSATHKALARPAEKVTLLLQADQHISDALGPYRSLLLHREPDAAPAMCVFACLLAVYTLASAQLQPPEDPLQPIIHCFRLVRGCREVIVQDFEKILASAVRPMMTGAMWDEHADYGIEVVEVLRLKQLAGTTSNEQAYVEAVGQLHSIYVQMQRCHTGDDPSELSPLGLIFAWPAIMKGEFAPLLYAQEETAMVILAHFSVLLCRYRACWWIQDWGDRMIRAIESQLSSAPEYRSWLEWPLEQAGIREASSSS